MIPFAVVGSDQEYQVNGRRLLGRKTKWGTIEGIVTFCSLNLFSEEIERKWLADYADSNFPKAHQGSSLTTDTRLWVKCQRASSNEDHYEWLWVSMNNHSLPLEYYLWKAQKNSINVEYNYFVSFVNVIYYYNNNIINCYINDIILLSFSRTVMMHFQLSKLQIWSYFIYFLFVLLYTCTTLCFVILPCQ